MKKLIKPILLLLIGTIFSFMFSMQVFAVKKKLPIAQTLKVVNNDGTTEIDGSILRPRVNEVNVLLSKQLLCLIS